MPNHPDYAIADWRCADQAPDVDPAIAQFLNYDWERLPLDQVAALGIYGHAVNVAVHSPGVMLVSVVNMEHGIPVATALSATADIRETTRAFINAVFNTLDEQTMSQPPPPRLE